MLPPDYFDTAPPEPLKLDHVCYELRLDLLPPRVREVADRLCRGQHVADIAESMGITQNTVHNHLKLGLKRLRLVGGRDSLVAFCVWGTGTRAR